MCAVGFSKTKTLYENTSYVYVTSHIGLAYSLYYITMYVNAHDDDDDAYGPNVHMDAVTRKLGMRYKPRRCILLVNTATPSI